MTSIALFTYSVKPRGSVVHAACLAEALVAEGAEVTLYALAKPGDRFFRPLRCPLVTFDAAPAPADPGRLIEQRIAELHAGLRGLSAQHDVYHAEDCLTASALLSVGLSRYSPVVRTVHHVERFENPYLAACQRRSIERADALVSVSRFTAREVEQGFCRQSRVVYNGVDPARFAPGAPGTSACPPALDALELRDDELVVLSVGGVEERKNTLRALEAVIPVCRAEPRLRWLVAGGCSIWDHSALEQSFDARVAELPPDVRRRITRLGPLDEAALTYLYRRSDVLLAPALHEGFGLSVLEAMAARTAVICSGREPFSEFTDSETAYWVDPYSVTSIREALRVLGADPALRARLASAAELRSRAFSWRAAARAHLELYASVGSGGARSARVSALPAA
jgi:glycosyltransferase-like protein